MSRYEPFVFANENVDTARRRSLSLRSFAAGVEAVEVLQIVESVSRRGDAEQANDWDFGYPSSFLKYQIITKHMTFKNLPFP